MSSIILDLRGTRVTVPRQELMELPEAILITIFPMGCALGKDGQVYYIDFDAACLEFVLDFFTQARARFYTGRDLVDNQHTLSNNPLLHKQAIIVLREELEYFAIPPPASSSPTPTPSPQTDHNGQPNESLLKLKLDCGNSLLARTSIFTALQRNVNRENNVAEQHLIDMLCMSGFEREDTWGYRSLEPNRCCIASIALVLLKTGIVHPPPIAAEQVIDGVVTASSGVKESVQVNAQQLATAQKLLLFWRKPARKCWWDATEIMLEDAQEIKVWARRVWTLELSLI